jgi:VanZ family protein
VIKLLTLARIGAGLAVLTIIVLSVVPGNMRPHVLGNDLYEHFAAYFITGGLLAAGDLCPVRLFLSGVLLALCGGSMEVAQFWIPGRTASAVDFAISTMGAWVGLLAMAVVRRVRERRLSSPAEKSECFAELRPAMHGDEPPTRWNLSRGQAQGPPSR